MKVKVVLALQWLASSQPFADDHPTFELLILSQSFRNVPFNRSLSDPPSLANDPSIKGFLMIHIKAIRR